VITSANPYFNVYFKTNISTALVGGTLTMEYDSIGMTRIA
jgi:hypothetical protein